jgi:geranylgeranyl diphosphate synthase type II
MMPVATPLDAGTDVESQLAAYRDLVTPVMMDSVPNREPRQYLYDPVRRYLSREGKGIRSALCIATCRAFGGNSERALPSAAAIELLHNALLVHDDIEDNSDYRRDQPTLHRQYGVPLAVNVGDAMNAMSVRALKSNLPLLGPELTWRIFEEFDHMTLETIEGQAMELGWIRDNDCDTSEDDYVLMVLKKTCWYSFIHPSRIGAIISGNDGVDLDAFNRFGYYLGVAFQVQDDLLNLVGDRKRYGKEIGGDILEGKRTIMLAHLFKNANAADRDRLKAFFAKPRAQRLPREAAWVKSLLGGYGSIEYGKAAAREFVVAARREFDVAYAGAADGSDTNFVRGLVEYVVSRTG